MKAASWRWKAIRLKSQSELHSPHSRIMNHSLQQDPFRLRAFSAPSCKSRRILPDFIAPLLYLQCFSCLLMPCLSSTERNHFI